MGEPDTRARTAGAGLPAKLAEHPSVRAVLARQETEGARTPPPVIDADWLRELCLRVGADDAAAVSLDHPDLAGEVEYARTALPGAKSMISLVGRMNRDNVRSVARSVANKEFHQTDEHLGLAAREVVTTLQDKGYRAVNPSIGFPMEVDRYPGRIWVVAHKTVAVAAGIGVMGLHRNVIHPKFGSFILLATVLVDAEVSAYGTKLDYNPCVDCKLCVAACPVGAIGKDGSFNPLSCSTHNYREFLGGFTDWAQTVADSTDGAEFRARVTDQENVSMWQSLAFKPNYKAAYCLAVCPAGEDVLPAYLDDRKQFMATVLKPLQDKRETLYVLPDSPAKQYAQRRFPHKTVKEVNGGRPAPPASA